MQDTCETMYYLHQKSTCDLTNAIQLKHTWIFRCWSVYLHVTKKIHADLCLIYLMAIWNTQKKGENLIKLTTRVKRAPFCRCMWECMLDVAFLSTRTFWFLVGIIDSHVSKMDVMDRRCKHKKHTMQPTYLIVIVTCTWSFALRQIFKSTDQGWR